MNNPNLSLVRQWRSNVRNVLIVGIVLFVAAFLVAGHVQSKNMTTLAGEVTGTLQQQCDSYNKLTTTDRTKSLFRLTATMQQISNELGEKPSQVNDEFLGERVSQTRLTGISVLDEDFQLVASGNTRRFQGEGWENTALGANIADIAQHPAKVFAERIAADDNYYDVCAVARKDAPGVIIGYYEQPTGLVANMEDDLESLLTGLQLESGGNYVIAENGHVRASSDRTMKDKDVSQDELLSQLSQLESDDHLHFREAGSATFLGYRTVFGTYDLYVYYPSFSVFSVAITAAGIVAVLFLMLCFGFFFIRGRTLYLNQEKLEESNRSLSETVEMLKSLETIYFTLLRVDLNSDEYRAIYLAPWMESNIPESGSYSKLQELFRSNLVDPTHRTNVAESLSAKCIKRSLGRNGAEGSRASFYADYLASANGETLWCRITFTAVDYDESGAPDHVLMLLQDIDEEKRKEVAYQERITKEAHAAKVANDAKGEFLRRISHDIRTPINGVKGYLNIAAAHPNDLAIQEDCRKKSLMALGTLMSLVNSVLDMSKLENSEISLADAPFDLNDLLSRVETIVEPQAKAANIRCDIEMPAEEEAHHLRGSMRHVGQVLTNLLTNAVKYGKPGGYVRLSTNLVSLQQNIATYEFVCEDDGIGMSEEFQQRLFEPFTQEASNARTVYEGSGLGLSIVKKLVEAMNGSISCISKKGEGTTFRVTLSFAVDVEASKEKAARKTRTDALQGAQVLLVEDNDMNMEVAEYLLVECGAKVTKAWNGKEAVNAFEQSEPGFFDLILMDVMMPEMNGLEATRAIRALNRPDAKTVPIAAMSANAFADDVKASLDAGMNEHIAKPVSVGRLHAVANELIGK